MLKKCVSFTAKLELWRQDWEATSLVYCFEYTAPLSVSKYSKMTHGWKVNTQAAQKTASLFFFHLFPPPHKRSFKMKGFLFEMQSEEITPSSCFNTDKYRLSTNQMWSEERLQIGGRMVWREENKKEEKHHHQRLIPTEIVPCGQDLAKEKSPLWVHISTAGLWGWDLH